MRASLLTLAFFICSPFCAAAEETAEKCPELGNSITLQSLMECAGSGINQISNRALILYDKVTTSASDFSGELALEIDIWPYDADSLEESANSDEFMSLIQKAGFELKSINLGIGLVPEFSLSLERYSATVANNSDVFQDMDEYADDLPWYTSFDERFVFSALKRIVGSANYKAVDDVEIIILPLPQIDIVYLVNMKAEHKQPTIKIVEENLQDLRTILTAIETELDTLLLHGTE